MTGRHHAAFTALTHEPFAQQHGWRPSHRTQVGCESVRPVRADATRTSMRRQTSLETCHWHFDCQASSQATHLFAKCLLDTAWARHDHATCRSRCRYIWGKRACMQTHGRHAPTVGDNAKIAGTCLCEYAHIDGLSHGWNWQSASLLTWSHGPGTHSGFLPGTTLRLMG